MRWNIEAMNSYCQSAGVSLAPHAKTTMAPFVIEAQLTSGVWGLTVATLQQFRLCLELGARNILIANEIVNPAGVRWLGTQLNRARDCTVYSIVDSVASVEALARACVRRAYSTAPHPSRGRSPGRRTGCRSLEEARNVAEAVKQGPDLVLAGVEGYEGVIGTTRSADELARVDAYLATVVEWTAALDNEGTSRVWGRQC